MKSFPKITGVLLIGLLSLARIACAGEQQAFDREAAKKEATGKEAAIREMERQREEKRRALLAALTRPGECGTGEVLCAHDVPKKMDRTPALQREQDVESTALGSAKAD